MSQIVVNQAECSSSILAVLAASLVDSPAPVGGMGKDIFGKPRYHCKLPSCNCNEFLSHAQQDIIEAEENGRDREEMESVYHTMTCQAKSEYQLTCVCGHRDSDHSIKEKEVAVAEKPKSYITESEACLMEVLQGACFRKDSADPETSAVVRFKRQVGSTLRCTGRCWHGPAGGVWAELDATAENRVGWVLIEGPGFGMEGALLRRVELSIQDSNELEAGLLKDNSEQFTLQQAKKLISQIKDACSSSSFQEKASEPLLVGELFMDVCRGPAFEFGFGAGEEGLRNMLVAIKSFKDDPDVEASLEQIDNCLHLGPGSVLALADA